jgi:hypothetical protein
MRAKPLRCATCKKNPLKNGSFTYLSGGAVKEDGKGTQFKGAISWLDIGVHGFDLERLKPVSTIENVAAQKGVSEFERVFCSPACLRKFLNTAVDRLETKLRKTRK